MSEWLKELAYGLRQVVKYPISSAAMILILAIGIGSNTGNFSIVNSILLKPLPFKDPDALVHVYRGSKASSVRRNPFPATIYRGLQRESSQFESLAGYRYGDRNVILEGKDGMRLPVAELTPNLLPMLGVEPFMGRSFSETEEQPGQHRVALLSFNAWQQIFAGEPSAIGQTLNIESESFVVIGVMPRWFSFPVGGVKIWTALPRVSKAPTRSPFR